MRVLSVSELIHGARVRLGRSSVRATMFEVSTSRERQKQTDTLRALGEPSESPAESLLRAL